MQRSRCKSSLLDEHWKRKQRLKVWTATTTTKLNDCQKKTSLRILKEDERKVRKTATTCDILRATATTNVEKSMRRQLDCRLKRKNQVARKSSERPVRRSSPDILTQRLCQLIRVGALITLMLFTCYHLRESQVVAAGSGQGTHANNGHMQQQTSIDPRPTIYSGQVSFGLLLSAHSSLGAELSTSASQQRSALLALVPPPMNQEAHEEESNATHSAVTTSLPSPSSSGTMGLSASDASQTLIKILSPDLLNVSSNSLVLTEPLATSESAPYSLPPSQVDQSEYRTSPHQLGKRQIFEQRNKNQQRNSATRSQTRKNQLFETSPMCSQINANALYAGMGAIWASHQANLVGDTQLTVGTYVYDSCNDLDIGQRQSVRIVSNLNAFQQTTCEAPRGSPISLTIAHGDNQLKAIQLLTSFRVPVVTTKEPFELEDYEKLSGDQKRFLFSTAHSSRHLAVGAIEFTKRIVYRLANSPNLTNRDHKSSSKNGFVVISRNLPQRFINYLTEMLPTRANYKMLLSERPIDEISSLEILEDNLKKPADTSTSPSEPIADRVIKLMDGDLSLANSSPSTITDEAEGSTGDPGSTQEDDQSKMLSPAILMFITPSEAIDLVTRLRNDLAKVSSYYSLIVSTREDISPALQTIFQRGGSRLCSGKAFYTISPKPDDIGEFSRYFRDTIQMEGESSDHPLICEYAKYKSMTKTTSDLDDIGTEPVIKAVWAAATAFKTVYKKECGSSGSNSQASGTNVYRAQSDPQSGSGSPTTNTNGRVMNSRQSTSKSSECMVKMNKNLSILVQRALRQMDTTINSTGLQALDGFRLKFDDRNDLLTNKFSIKYINKECEITELGHYSGIGDPLLRLDRETLTSSFESTLPEAWPPKPVALNSQTRPIATDDNPQHKPTTNEASISAAKMDPSSDASTSPASNSDSVDTEGRHFNGRRYKANAEDDSTPSSGAAGEDEDGIASGPLERGGTGSESTDTPVPLLGISHIRESSRSNNRHASGRKFSVSDSRYKIQKKRQQPVTANGRGLAGVTDSETTTQTTITSSARGRMQRNPTEEFTTTLKTPLTKPMRELKSFPAQSTGTTLREWIPTGESDISTTTTTRHPSGVSSIRSSSISNNRLHDGDDERVDPGQSTDLRQKATTQAPVIYTTLPESGGNTDLDHPPTRMSSRRQPKTTTSRVILETSATTESSDYITSASTPTVQTGASATSPAPMGRLGLIVNSPLIDQNYRTVSANGIDSVSSPSTRLPTKLNYLSLDLNASPIPLNTSSPTAIGRESRVLDNQRPVEAALLDPGLPRDSRSRLRSHLKWIYSSWFGLTILAANICGALITLYILTFLLLKNCDGSLDRENQGIRSMHLLAIIVVFFGSTLFIVYPTPGLCLLRTSWQNFALVLLFGSLLLQTMQARSVRTLGLGGRPNRLNQFLTLVFMVGVQVSFELQRWKYESANYLNFVQQHFGSGATEVNQKLLMLTNSITTQFNVLNSLHDQVTPISIQISEQYQSLLSDYCTQKPDDYLQSQFYLFVLVLLLTLFSASTRRTSSLLSKSHQSGKLGSRRKLTSTALGAASGNLVASQHETNITSTHFQSPFTSTNPISGTNLEIGNVFAVSMVCIPIYMVSVFLHISGQSSINRDLIPSVTMVTIAFSALIGIFLPVLRQINRHEDLVEGSLPGGSAASRAIIDQHNNRVRQDTANTSPQQTSASAAFTMFPEFAQTGLKRPASTSGESGSGAGSRRPFADTKESRRNMGTMLANLGPSADSLRSMGFYDSRGGIEDGGGKIDPGMLNLQLNMSANNNISAHDELSALEQQNQLACKRLSKEKRLIMLDVDPCCPRHGVAAWPRSEESSSKGCRSRASHPH